MGVADDQLDTAESAGLERAQERGPERPVLAVADVEAQDFAPAVGGHAAIVGVAITTAWETTRRFTRALQ
jgi:hypothetical protein